MRPSLHSGRPQTAGISLNAKLNGPWHGKWKEKAKDYGGQEKELLAPACQMGTGQAADSVVKISF